MIFFTDAVAPNYRRLHLWTIKSPRTRRLISHKGNGYQAIEIAKGVIDIYYNPSKCIVNI